MATAKVIGKGGQGARVLTKGATGPVRDEWGVSQVAPPVSSGGRGGMMGGGAAAPAPAARMTFDQFLTGNPLYQLQMGEAGRLGQDYDAETLRMQQETQQQQMLQRAMLDRQLGEMANAGQGDLNARGLGRSGLAFQAQDKVNQFGVQQGNSIDQLLTTLLGQRGSGKIDLQAQNRASQNSLFERLLAQFNAGQAIG